jgi:hypothetical protein
MLLLSCNEILRTVDISYLLLLLLILFKLIQILLVLLKTFNIARINVRRLSLMHHKSPWVVSRLFMMRACIVMELVSISYMKLWIVQLVQVV